MDRRLQFVAEYLTGLYTMTELAAAYGVSRRIGYYWVNLYQREGAGRLAGASRRPHTSPNATAPAVVDRIVAASHAHPTWGAGKLRDWVRLQAPQQPWPCRDTFHVILQRHGRVRQRPRRRRALHPPPHLVAPTRPNLVWTADYKGEFRTRDGCWCYPFTLRDGYSRFVLRCTALPTHDGPATRREFTRAFHTFGLPDRIRTDNGPPFGGPGLARLSRLAVWWLRLGIHPERITPRHPEQNGSHEQFHRVLKQATTRPPATTVRAQQRRFDRFRTEYNHERPHDAVGHVPPASHYRPSPRPFPATVPPLDYPGAWPTRRVSIAGQITWRSRALFLSEVLAGQDVALEPIDDGLALVRFATIALARFDERRWQLLPLLPAVAASAGPHSS
ncbi:MAG TPA: integrase core domain-containing protein [Gemmatimonadales bacterium]|nr:integrase core domain-containing protein [Gemmatimonadales bacterium]